MSKLSPDSVAVLSAKDADGMQEFYLALMWFTHNKWVWHEISEEERVTTLRDLRIIHEDWTEVNLARKSRKEEHEPVMAVEVREAVKQLEMLLAAGEDRFYGFRGLLKSLKEAYRKRRREPELAELILARRRGRSNG